MLTGFLNTVISSALTPASRPSLNASNEPLAAWQHSPNHRALIVSVGPWAVAAWFKLCSRADVSVHSKVLRHHEIAIVLG